MFVTLTKKMITLVLCSHLVCHCEAKLFIVTVARDDDDVCTLIISTLNRRTVHSHL